MSNGILTAALFVNENDIKLRTINGKIDKSISNFAVLLEKILEKKNENKTNSVIVYILTVLKQKEVFLINNSERIPSNEKIVRQIV